MEDENARERDEQAERCDTMTNKPNPRQLTKGRGGDSLVRMPDWEIVGQPTSRIVSATSKRAPRRSRLRHK